HSCERGGLMSSGRKRVLFVLAGLVPFLVLPGIACAADDAQAAKFLEDQGGSLTISTALPGKPIFEVVFPYIKSDKLKAVLPTLAKLKHLKKLKTFRAGFTAADLKSLGVLDRLEVLDLCEPKIQEADLAGLAGLTQLRWLRVSRMPLTDA